MLAGIFRGADRAQLGELIFRASANEPYTIVWRLEDADGYGVYSNQNLARAREWLIEHGTEEELDRYFYVESENPHPVPNVDFNPEEWSDRSVDDARSYLFAFPSTSAATKWFGPLHIKALEAVGVHLVAKKASKVYLSKSKLQVIYQPYQNSKE